MQTSNQPNKNPVNKTCGQRLSCLASLAGGIIHEMHNGIGAIRSNAQALQLTRTKQNAEHLSFLEGAVDRMQELTQMLMLYTRDAVVDLERVPVQPIIENTIKTLKASPEFQDVEFRQEYANTRKLSAYTNANLLKRSIEALLRNAGEALGTEKRKISIHLSQGDHIECESGKVILGSPDANTPYLHLRIEDTGCGIAAGILPLIFDPFFTTKLRARGLGLAHVVGLVQLTNCILSCQTHLQKGTAFTLCIPSDNSTP